MGVIMMARMIPAAKYESPEDGPAKMGMNPRYLARKSLTGRRNKGSRTKTPQSP